MNNPFKNKQIGLYIHIPFCAKKCNYCSFNVNIINGIPEKKYLNKLIEEILHLGEYKYKTIYIGGGTPNLMSNFFYKKLFKYINIEESIEVTIELNPEFVTKEQINFYKSLGINRFSLGVQTFDKKGLEILGRNHSNEDALNAIDILSGENYSFDLIYGYPEQTIENLNYDLEQIIKIKPKHLSIYNLSYEEGAFFYKWKKNGKIKALDDEVELEMYNIINKEVGKIALKRYEISNFSVNGMESAHNMLYWTSSPYIGVGTAAHSYYLKNNSVIRSINEGKLRKYLNLSVENLKTEEVLSDNEYIFDRFYSEMRKLYIDIDDFLLHTGVDLFNILNVVASQPPKGGEGDTSRASVSDFVENLPFRGLEGLDLGNWGAKLKNLVEIKNKQLWLTDLGIINSDTVFEIFYDLFNDLFNDL